jgi:osmotically-inducible protein OsmY
MRLYRRVLGISLAAGFAVLAAATGCRTTQSPERQTRDMAITAEVKFKLASEIKFSTLTNISVNTTNGVVTLSGQVSDPDVRNRAEQVARAVPNVVQVYSNLRIEQAASRPNEPDDEERPRNRSGN